MGWRSRSSDCTLPYTIHTAMKDSSKVAMTSFVPTLAFNTPASAPHRPPARPAASMGNTQARPQGRSCTWPYRATAVAAMPPTAICPSPPTLVRLARWASTKPMPTRASTRLRLSEAARA
jgi:hypothetical protein